MNAHRIDENGFFIEQVELKEDEPLSEFIVLKGWEGKILFKPKFDIELDDWIEGLPEEEVSKLQAILQEQHPDELEILKQENTLLKAQIQAAADRSDFHEELIVEMAMLMYP